MILMLVLILTDTAGLSNRHMNIKEKGVLTFLLLAIAGMIWSALYLDFTEVGRTTIADAGTILSAAALPIVQYVSSSEASYIVERTKIRPCRLRSDRMH